MKLELIETYTKGRLCFVRVTDDQGAQGCGMAAPFVANITALVLHQLAAGVAFRPINDITTVADEILRHNFKLYGPFLCRAAAGIDTALWDLEAKKKGLSVAEMAGKVRDTIELYASSRKHDLPVQEEADRLRVIQDRDGYRSFKLHPGIPVGRDRDFWPNRAEDCVKAVVKALKPGTHLIADFNGNFSVPRAIEMGRFLYEQGVQLYEEPCPYWEYEKTKAVQVACADIGIAVAGGEADFIDTTWERMIDMRVMDVCQPDLLYLGGFSRALRIADYAAKRGLQVTPHTSNKSPIFVMGLHYMACIANPYPYLEVGIEDEDWELEGYAPLVEIKDGRAAVPSAPGWGFTPSVDFLKSAEYAVSRPKDR